MEVLPKKNPKVIKRFIANLKVLCIPIARKFCEFCKNIYLYNYI